MIREAKVGEGDSPAVREKLSTLGDAIRLYIIRVAGSVDRRHPETQVLADELRKPFAEWKTKHSRAVSPKAEKPADAPAAALEEKSKAHQ